MIPAADPSPSTLPSPEQILAAWRERIFFAIFLSVLLLGVVPLISSAFLSIQEERWINLSVFITGYLGIVLVLVFKQIPFSIRVMIGITVFYLIGVNNLVSIGLIGSGRIWLIAFSLIATLLMGLRAGLITLALNLTTLVTLGYLLAKGDLAWTSMVPMKSFVVTSITLIFLNALITLSLAVLFRALEQELLQKHRLSLELTAINEQLHQDRIKRRAAEEALIQSEKKLSQAIQGNSIPTFIIDNTHLITHWNHACEALTGFSEAEMKGTHQHSSAFYPKERSMLADFIVDQTPAYEIQRHYDEKLQASSLIQGAFEGEHFFSHFGKKGKWFYFTSAPLKDTEGNIIGAIETVQDITERKNTEAQLTQAQKMESVGRLAGGVAHDFNNMLGVILGHTELALLQADENHDLYADLKEIQKAAKRSADTTKQLLAFARKQTISPRQIDLNDTVESLLNMLRRLIGEDIDLVWHPSAHLWPVKMDPSQIDQILANLCVNARDAISGVGKLTIETGKKTFDVAYCNDHPGFIPGDFVLMAVSDNGCGMDKDILENLFEPFFTTKEVGKGTGLGLATIYGIVKQNNGFINVYSEPGQGSTFKIYLPRLVADEDINMAVPEKKAAAGGTETVLLVEDEPAILRMTGMMLERKGYSVLSAATPAEAVEKAKNHSGAIDLLMTDVVMPEMNGRDLAEQIATLYPNIRLLFMSGYTANVIAHHGVLDVGVAFIQKPFSMADMTMKVRAVLDMVSDKNQG